MMGAQTLRKGQMRPRARHSCIDCRLISNRVFMNGPQPLTQFASLWAMVVRQTSITLLIFNFSVRDMEEKNQRSLAERLKANPAYGVGAVAGVLMMPAIAYLGYDLARAELSPCDAIFEQASVGLTTNIRFLKVEGQLQIGKTQLAELDDRAQTTALNLKTCCTVLDRGKIDPEQFLQCKSKTRAYESQIEELVTLVKAMSVAKQPAPKESSLAVTTATAAVKAPPKEITKKVEATVKQAVTVSKNFNQQVAQVQKKRALETLKMTPPKTVDVSGEELEPNSDLLNTNAVKIGEWITAAISEGKDADFFTFKTPEAHRDWIQIQIMNRSTTLEPRIFLYNSGKTHIGSHRSETPGGDLTYNFVAPPSTTYIARVSNYWGKSKGVYLMRVNATKSYDKYEPNETILVAQKISVGTPIEAAIMDGKDIDYFAFETGSADGAHIIKVENRSTTLHPKLSFYNGSKTHLGSPRNETAGGDLTHELKTAAKSKYYVAVGDYWGKQAGAYTLSVSKK